MSGLNFDPATIEGISLIVGCCTLMYILASI